MFKPRILMKRTALIFIGVILYCSMIPNLLNAGKSESIQITVKMPEELGNEFQESEAVVN